MPTMVQSVGVLSRLNGNDASLPRHQKTNSPTPAPTESSATVGFPFGFRSASSVCTIKSFRPSRVSFLMEETTVPITRASCISFWLLIQRFLSVAYVALNLAIYYFGYLRREHGLCRFYRVSKECRHDFINLLAGR